MKFVLTAFDGLRPDMISRELMPNLFGFIEENVFFERHRCVFPSETYVNTASLVTGTTPSVHGLVANIFSDPRVDPKEPFAGFSVPRIEKAQAAYGGKLYDAPSVGRNTRPSRPFHGGRQHEFTGKRPSETSQNGPLSPFESQLPQLRNIVSEIGSGGHCGPIRRAEGAVFPDFEGLRFSTDVVLEYLVPNGLPDLTFLWYGEPDNCYHAYGVGSPESRSALEYADRQFGRVLYWWRSEGRDRDVQLIVFSDHGHVTQDKKVSVASILSEAGFAVGSHLEDGADIALIPGYSGNLIVKDRNPGRIASVAKFLSEVPFVGALFSRGKNEVEGIAPGTFSLGLVGAQHPRSPDIAYVLHTDDYPNPYGYEGACYFDNDFPLGAGMHGGLHPKELTCVLAAGGSLFREKTRIETPSGITDILSTVLQGLNAPLPESIRGRVLTEALSNDTALGSFVEPRVCSFETGLGRYMQRIAIAEYAGGRYIESGGRVTKE